MLSTLSRRRRAGVRRTFTGWLISRDGYRVKLIDRTTMVYVDSLGKTILPAEMLAYPTIGAILFVEDIPDTPERPRATVVDNVRRAYDAVGWKLLLA